MIANRRSCWNFSLDRALDYARALAKPLLVLEALRLDYKWASQRLHQFVIDGMRANQAAFADSPITYFPYLETRSGEGSGLLEWLAERAAVVVTDDFPCFFLPRMLTAAARRIQPKLEAVDSNGLFPMRATDRTFARAVDFRRYLQKHLERHLDHFPQASPLARLELKRLSSLPQGRWRPSDLSQLRLEDLPVPALPGPVRFQGGSAAATELLDHFLHQRLAGYDERNDPERKATSGFSPYLHFGHLSSHQVFHEVAERAGWRRARLGPQARGQRTGWWGLELATESFLDQLVTWRELGYNMCATQPAYDRWESLPQWASASLEEHADDPRDHVYSLDRFEQANTHDPLWNAVQNQLRQEGVIHNYLRMLWGKKVLHWTRHPREALEILIELNNKYALDGRNPNSYSGIFWIFGRYDRAWGPERPIFGKIRYMTSDSTRRKFNLEQYLARYS